MKTTVFVKAGQVAVQEVEKPQLVEADDAIIRVVRTSGVIGVTMIRLRVPTIVVMKLSESSKRLVLPLPL